jgi:hypothetical protein
MSANMTWEQKLDALNALAECSLLMRKPGNWYVSQRTELKDECFLVGTYGNGASPEEAVLDHWRVLVDEVPLGQYIVAHSGTERRKAVLWNGYMWRDYPEPHRAEATGAE